MHQKLEDLKKATIDNVQKGIESLFVSASALADQHKDLEDKVKIETTNFLSLQAENTKTKQDTTEMLKQMQAERSKLESDKTTAKTDVVQAVQNKNQILIEVEALKTSIAKLTKDKADAEADAAKVQPLTLVKQTLEKEIDTINQTIATQTKELADLVDGKGVELESITKSIEAAQSKLDIINEDIASQEKVMAPRIIEINEREKASVAKEEALLIIEKRYITLFKEKGVSIKI